MYMNYILIGMFIIAMGVIITVINLYLYIKRVEEIIKDLTDVCSLLNSRIDELQKEKS